MLFVHSAEKVNSGYERVNKKGKFSMNSVPIRIQFHGIKTPDKLLKQIKEYVEALLLHSPSSSICRFHIFKEQHSYLCKLTVHSSTKTFSSQDRSKDLGESIKSVLRDVKRQIATWKKKRTSYELTGVHSITNLTLNPIEDEDEHPPVDNEDILLDTKKKVA